VRLRDDLRGIPRRDRCIILAHKGCVPRSGNKHNAGGQLRGGFAGVAQGPLVEVSRLGVGMVLSTNLLWNRQIRFVQRFVNLKLANGQIAIRASALDGNLRIEVENEGIQSIGMDAPDLTDQGRGLGLANARARLDQLYGSAATLNTCTTENGNFDVSISIPLSIPEHTTTLRLEESSL
jgi:hypothetical protein